MLDKKTKEAIDLLKDENLVWSSDMEDIKEDLANLLLICSAHGDMFKFLADNLAKKILYSGRGANYSPQIETR